MTERDSALIECPWMSYRPDNYAPWAATEEDTSMTDRDTSMTDRDFHFQVRCTDPACALAQPIRTVYRESADEVGEYHVAHSGHRCVVERIGEQHD